MQLILLCKTAIMNNLLRTLWFQDQVRIKLQDRDIYHLTTHITIPHLGKLVTTLNTEMIVNA